MQRTITESLIVGALVLVHLVWLAGCDSVLPQGDYSARLPNGYRLVRTNAPTVCIWSPDGPSATVVVPAKIVEIGVHEALVMGRVEYSPDSDPPVVNAVGYFILDTNSGDVEMKLSEEEFYKNLKERGLADHPKLARPSASFKY